MKMLSVSHLNKTFPKFPITVSDKGWVYGVWYCGTSWDKVRLHGQYPLTFLKRALALFPNSRYVLHCPSGTVTGPGICIDINQSEVQKPHIVASASHLPLQSNLFDLILSDPPYTEKDSEIYDCKPFPMGAFMREARRILKPGGHLGMLHTYYPSYRRKEWKLVGLIAVVTGFQRATRIFSIFEKL